MDPYARLRVGHNVYETPTCQVLSYSHSSQPASDNVSPPSVITPAVLQNGSKEPKWNKTINCFLMAGARSVDVEIYDECTFSPDALVAHTSIPLPPSLLQVEYSGGAKLPLF